MRISEDEMKHWFLVTKRWSLAIASAATLTIGAMALLSCGGEGGPINSGGGGGGGGNSFTAQFLALLPAGQAGATYVGPTVCKTCHNGGAAAARNAHGRAPNPSEHYYDEWAQTVHASKNVTCEQCHGPGSKHANSATPDGATILGVPNNNATIVCAQCHGPLYDQWKDTHHAAIIPDPVRVAAASQRTSRCIQCHAGIWRTEVSEQGIDPTNTTTLPDAMITNYTNWSAGPDDQHPGIVPNTATCATCHNPHAVTGNLTWEGEEKQLRHTEFNTDTTQVAYPAVTATFANFDQICAQCHNGRAPNNTDANLATSGSTGRPAGHHSDQYNMLMGTGGVEGSGPVQRNMAHATAPGQCSHCHMPNSSHTWVVSYDVSCQPCHDAAGAAAISNSAKTTIINSMYAVLTRLETWSSTAFPGHSNWWDYTTNIAAPAPTSAQEATVPLAVRRARANYWYILIDNSFGPHNFPYMTTLIDVANQNLDSIGVPPAPPSGGRAANLTTAQKLQIMRAQLAQYKRNDQG